MITRHVSAFSQHILHLGLRFKIMGVLLLAMAMTGLILGSLSYHEAQNHMRERADLASKTFQDLVTSAIHIKEQDYAMTLETLLQNREILDAFSKGDRETLTSLTLPFYEQRLKTIYDIEQFQFHLPPATSFLRVHEPRKFADDLSAFRKTVLVTNQERKPVIGLEVGRGGPGLRVVYPVFVSERHTGSVEFGGDLKGIFASAQKATGAEFAIGIRAKVFETAKRFADNSRDIVHGDMLYYDFSAPITKKILAKFLDKSTQTIQAVEGHDWMRAYFPLTDYSGTAIGHVVVFTDVTTMQSQALQELAVKFGIMTLLAIAVGIGIYFQMHTLVLSPIQQAVEFASRLAQGNLTGVLESKRQDEMGTLVHALNNMNANLRDMISNLSQRSRELTENAVSFSEVSENLFKGASDLENKSVTVNQTILSLDNRMLTVASAMEEMNANMHTVSETSEQMSANMGTISAAAEEASTNLSTVASAAEQASTNMIEVQKSVGRSTDNIHAISSAIAALSTTLVQVRDKCGMASQESETASQNSQTNSAVMARLADSVQEIGKVVEVINNIADQTNMLALNAAIEAAGAGDAGKGFAVVANEVKDLARQTSEATKMIAERIAQIRNQTQEVNDATSQVTRIIDRIRQVNEDILFAMEEQEKSVLAVAENMHATSRETSQVTELVEQSTAGFAEVSRSVHEISQGINEVTRSVADASLGVGEMSRNVAEATLASAEIARNITETTKLSTTVVQAMAEVNQASKTLFDHGAVVDQHARDVQQIATSLDTRLRDFQLQNSSAQETTSMVALDPSSRSSKASS
ncbi:MAG: HAMP domain-containing protein [Magnetococcales bacterium]|nr:HAMP domain-containing protein [Magnetococcales bacterium]